MGRMFSFFTMSFLVFALSGCGLVAGLPGRSPSLMVQKGMTKDQVLAFWGEPDYVRDSDNSRVYSPHEEAWHYRGLFFNIFKQQKSVYYRGGKVDKVFVGKWSDRYLQ